MALTRSQRRNWSKILTDDDHDQLLDVCGGRCFICGQFEGVPDRSLAIDHDHRTGAIRGLLCTRCNRKIASPSSDPVWLRLAAEYLERSHLRFGHFCRDCLRADDFSLRTITLPVLESTNGKWSVFFYECKRSHEFRIGFSSSGLGGQMTPLPLPVWQPMPRDFPEVYHTPYRRFLPAEIAASAA